MLVLAWLLLVADQPIAYSHKTHVQVAKLACKECHTMPGIGERATYPATAKCMACHTSIKADSPEIAKLAKFHQDKRPVPWVRIYEIPGYVFFNHKVHVDAGATCEKCHGPVGERDVVTKEVKHNMGSCMNCHRENKAPNDCLFCHERQN